LNDFARLGWRELKRRKRRAPGFARPEKPLPAVKNQFSTAFNCVILSAK
jgi:hypothetical protein